MDYSDKIAKIKLLTGQNRPTNYIIDKLDISKNDFYNICRREGIKYNKQPIKGGRMIGARDKQPRTRKTKTKIKKGGSLQQIEEFEAIRAKQKLETEEQINEYDLYLKDQKNNVPTDIDKFIQSVYTDLDNHEKALNNE